MKIKQKIVTLLAAAVFTVGAALFATAPTSLAADERGNQNCGVNTSIINCGSTDTTKDGVENTGLWAVIIMVLNILTAGVGIAAVGGVVYGAVLYTSAGSSQEQVKKAIGVISNVVIGIIAYAAMYVGLNFLIPGGLFT